ncbi:MAG TPA: Minf_1886 family protein [Tepidisphaeraceae bacterium]|nr:Minf_1886 family protein [Tepidisphaeraceae bacterium]
MPPPKEPAKQKSLQQLARDVGPYPAEAYDFIQRGLSYTVQKLHGTAIDPDASRHVSGQQLCEGLREFALKEWGLLAHTVLKRWGILSTLDFGRIVFALIDAGQMQKTDDDNLEDFRNVFDFKQAFEAGYRIQLAS